MSRRAATGFSGRSRFAANGALRGRARVPGDKSISHRALLLGALAEGDSEVTGLSDGDDVRRTRAALSGLGAGFDGVRIHGGRSVLVEASSPLDLGNSGTGIRLLAGVVAGCSFTTVLTGDASVRTRPMARIVVPLRAMGAVIDGDDDGRLAPLTIRGGGLSAIDHTSAVPSAQVKGALLFAGLAASGTTIVRETTPTRRHSEELLLGAGASLEMSIEDGVYVVRVRPGPLVPFRLAVPGDPSQAAFLVVAACIVAGSELLVENVYVGPGRAGFLGVLERMGADIERVGGDESTADLLVRHGPLVATTIGGAEIADCIDELPVLSVAAAFAEGTTTISDASELRVKESDRIATTVAGLAAIGVRASETADGLRIEGNPRLSPSGVVSSHDDHRIAMAFAVAGLAGADAGEGVTIEGFGATATSWPGFEATIGALS